MGRSGGAYRVSGSDGPWWRQDSPEGDSAPENAGEHSDGVNPDAMQLFNVATFNGLSRVIAALAENGLLTADQLENIEDSMTAPLDDPDWRDDPFIASTRNTVASVLAQATIDIR